ncbi:hypothetical protein BDZ45DRAFT_112572 [Acephala macrosclerotiorum]|nr:hypothetical protein BDZ45DRAFT_112572 [Acephala macrosclerotiorum]
MCYSHPYHRNVFLVQFLVVVQSVCPPAASKSVSCRPLVSPCRDQSRKCNRDASTGGHQKRNYLKTMSFVPTSAHLSTLAAALSADIRAASLSTTAREKR